MTDNTTHKLTALVCRMPSAVHTMRSQIIAQQREGFSTELCINTANGDVLVTIHRPDEQGWTTYALSPGDLVDGVLELDESLRVVESENG